MELDLTHTHKHSEKINIPLFNLFVDCKLSFINDDHFMYFFFHKSHALVYIYFQHDLINIFVFLWSSSSLLSSYDNNYDDDWHVCVVCATQRNRKNNKETTTTKKNIKFIHSFITNGLSSLFVLCLSLIHSSWWYTIMMTIIWWCSHLLSQNRHLQHSIIVGFFFFFFWWWLWWW